MEKKYTNSEMLDRFAQYEQHVRHDHPVEVGIEAWDLINDCEE